MFPKTIFFLPILFRIIIPAVSQSEENWIVEGRIFNAQNNEPIPFANIVIWGTTIGSTSDYDGRFLFTGIEAGYVELRASSVGFKPYISESILVTNANKVFIEILLEETDVELEAVVVKASPFRKVEESPVSMRRIDIQEIEKNPGGNRDISRVIQSLPGVASSVSYRNDLIVKGGGPMKTASILTGWRFPPSTISPPRGFPVDRPGSSTQISSGKLNSIQELSRQAGEIPSVLYWK